MSMQKAAGTQAHKGPSVYSFSFFCLTLGMIFYVLEAYSLWAIPLSWLSDIFFVLSLVILIRLRHLPVPMASVGLIALYGLWGIFAMAVYNMYAGAPQMPPLATTSYEVFVGLRLLKIISFACALTACHVLVCRGWFDKLVLMYSRLLLFVLIAAIYIYLAQVYGWWELPRNRMGTGGQNFLTEPIVFSFDFHRAMGTFREPSHLAEWLSAAFLFVVPNVRKIRPYQRVFLYIGFSLVLAMTGSLLGIFCLIAGSMVFFQWKRMARRIILALSMLTFGVLLAGYLFNIEIVPVLSRRIEVLLESGSIPEERIDLHGLLSSVPISFVGYGLGNTVLIWSAARGSYLVLAILNLFVVAMYDAGIVGGLSLIAAFSIPFVSFLKKGNRIDNMALGGMAAHLSWIVAYIGRAGELNSIHAVALGALLAALRKSEAAKERRSDYENQYMQLNANRASLRPMRAGRSVAARAR